MNYFDSNRADTVILKFEAVKVMRNLCITDLMSKHSFGLPSA
jgi:hypothetical protein